MDLAVRPSVRLPLVGGAVASPHAVRDRVFEALDHLVVGVVEGDRTERKETDRVKHAKKEKKM
jgi:hypothetical protein